ncbi:DinB family protein [Winogradskyella sp. DF17]|uniref:DinB family protein n=1 Tax=Winogradskyella pelagia TaxID=2819984 RepID=A0ABS3T2B9_9FLAO|nr:DinB family protein [Winogradskyella sp. DF17]MBO3116888.1 DinB family protein [Winogradskyella sp. DF17]
MKNLQLEQNEYNPYYQPYVDRTSHVDIITGLKENLRTVINFYESVPKEKHNFAYAHGKWTIKEVLLHCIDTERVFSYRALRISRSDQTEMAGFDQDKYVEASQANRKSFEYLLDEYRTVRLSTIALFKSFGPEDLVKTGRASGSNISLRAIGYIITGHENHHINVLKECYL